MPLLIFLARSGNYPDLAVNRENYFVQENIFLLNDIFYLTGEPIMLGGVGWRLRCSPFAVFKYSFMGHCLADIEVGLGGWFDS